MRRNGAELSLGVGAQAGRAGQHRGGEWMDTELGPHRQRASRGGDPKQWLERRRGRVTCAGICTLEDQRLPSLNWVGASPATYLTDGEIEAQRGRPQS